MTKGQQKTELKSKAIQHNALYSHIHLLSERLR